jgi:hypothetical protein
MDFSDYWLRQGLLRMLEIKDADIRILTLEQGRDAVDKGIHIGGAFCASMCRTRPGWDRTCSC